MSILKIVSLSAMLLSFSVAALNLNHEQTTKSFFDAIATGITKDIEFLLSNGINPMSRDENGNTALHHCALSNNSDKQNIGLLLIESGINPLSVNNNKQMASDLIASDSINDHFLDFLRDEEKRAYLKIYLLISSNKISELEKQLELGLNINYQNPHDGNTFLHIAHLYPEKGSIGLFLQREAIENMKNFQGYEPEENAFIHARNKELFSILQNSESLLNDTELSEVENLLAQQADPNGNMHSSNGKYRYPSYLMAAIMRKDMRLTKALLSSTKIEINASHSITKHSALHVAVRMRNVEAVKLLLEHQANPNHQGDLQYGKSVDRYGTEKHDIITDFPIEELDSNAVNNRDSVIIQLLTNHPDFISVDILTNQLFKETSKEDN